MDRALALSHTDLSSDPGMDCVFLGKGLKPSDSLLLLNGENLILALKSIM